MNFKIENLNSHVCLKPSCATYVTQRKESKILMIERQLSIENHSSWAISISRNTQRHKWGFKETFSHKFSSKNLWFVHLLMLICIPSLHHGGVAKFVLIPRKTWPCSGRMNSGSNVTTSVYLSNAKPIEESFVAPRKVDVPKGHFFTCEPRAVTM